MRGLVVVVLVGVIALTAGVVLGYVLDDDSDPAAEATALPAAVEERRVALLEAAESGNYDAVAELIPADGFEYTFGGPVEGGPAAYWREVERTTGERPLDALAAILKMPYVLTRGYYVWPWAYSIESSTDLSPHEQELLAPLGPPSELFPEGVGYLGWRTGIAQDGSWTFFVAGD